MIHLALAYDDGRLGIMQYYAEDTSDAAIDKEIAKMLDKPGAWQRVTAEEAAAIRAARPKPEPQVPPGSTPVPAVNIAEITLVRQENEDLKARILAVESQFAMFAQGLSEAIAKHKAQDGS